MEPRKSKVFIAVDLGRDDMNSEVITRHHPDGTVEIISIHTWDKEITLTKSEYKINNPR